MKTKLSILVFLCFTSWILYTGFSNDDDPKWSNNARTIINLNPEGQYVDLPAGTGENYSNETRYISTPQGTFAVGPNFRVHPTTARTQSETPIIRHPQNPNIMFASANTYNVGGATSFSCGHYITTNGGVTWFGDDTTNFNFGDPAPMIMHTGRVLISYITSTGSMGAAYSTDLGTTWSGTVSFPNATTSADKNLSAVDGTPTSSFYGRCYTVYTEFAGANINRIVATWSADGGVTWSAIVPISPVPSAGHHHQGCDVTVDIYGFVRVVYANCTTNGQNSTEDFLGWAESGTGGVSWSDMSDVKVNTNGIRSADFLTPSSAIIRVNGFPRIDGDKTCNPSADDEYVVMAEKNFAPALDNGDIVLMKTPDGGTSWTRVRVNQNASGSYEWSPAVNVDATGAINVCYYSTRNVPTNDSAEIYLSRSTDGGLTFTDVKVSDHKFKPIPISGLAAGYQGDYIGITSGGAGKIVPYWCEQGPVSGGRYQAWSALVDVTIGNPCEDFSCTKDTGSTTLPVFTEYFYEEFSGTNYWNRRSTATAYGIGTGAARFNSWNASSGTTQSLVSYQFPSAAANTYLTFDNAYAPWSGGGVEHLFVECSNNSGVSYTTLSDMQGGLGAQAGSLNTVFTGGGQFTPSSRQWAPKIFLLPVGTNKVRLRAVSGFGNDIWVDNICVQVLTTPVTNSIGIVSDGLWKFPGPPYTNYTDTFKVFLYRTDFPNIAVDSGKGAISTSDFLNFPVPNALSGIYYRVVKHRNSIMTWSNAGYAYTRGANTHHNFLTPANQSYGNNMKLVNPFPYYAMFSGDINQDDIIDGGDISLCANASAIALSVYVAPDVNGDFYVDASDQSIVENNTGEQVVAPPGASPSVYPIAIDRQTVFNSDAERQKYEQTIIQIEKENLIYKQSEENKKSEKSKKKSKITDGKKVIAPVIENSNSENDNGIRAGQ
ncbi:MAG: hypothetical protein LH629_14515 [Ignavibacteria bacterium]|nr:hypothetical protein [Ignavibacteria bacterium]